ncbi:MAG TPA: AraC family transcriptional regulator [Polyangiales bacterium]
MSGPDPVSIPAVYARELIALSERFGVAPERLLEGFGKSQAELNDPALRIPLKNMGQLTKRALALTNEPGLAFYMGLQMRLSQHGFLGFAAMTARDLGEAVALAERFGSTRTTAISLHLVVEGALAAVTLEEHVDLGELREFLVVALFSGMAQLAQAVTGRQLNGVVDLSFEEPAYFQRFAHVVPADVRFSRPDNRLIFSEAFLSYPIIGADPVAMQLAREQCERELATLSAGVRLLDQVRALLHGAGRELPSLEQVSKALHVSSRTLKRKLTEHGTSFSRIVDAHLRGQALLLIEDARLTIDEIADRLGYSDTANFARAFKRWTGSAPGAFRTQGKSG